MDRKEKSHYNSRVSLHETPTKKSIGATGVRYIQMGQASHVQENKEWNLKETIRQAERKFSTDLKMIAMESTNDDKLLKTLLCLERKTTTQISNEYKNYTKNLSTRFEVVFYDDKIIVPRSLRNTVIIPYRTTFYQQDVTGHKTNLVAKGEQKYATKMQRVCSLQNDR